MLPTLNYAGDFVHADKTCRRGRRCQVGDLVVAVKPTDPEQRVCKRITGMAGDVVQVDPSSAGTGDDGQDAQQQQQYIKVPEGHCWVTGDNLSESLDSRSYGAMPLGLIKGRIFAVHTSDGEFRWLPNNFRATTEGV